MPVWNSCCSVYITSYWVNRGRQKRSPNPITHNAGIYFYPRLPKFVFEMLHCESDTHTVYLSRRWMTRKHQVNSSCPHRIEIYQFFKILLLFFVILSKNREVAIRSPYVVYMPYVVCGDKYSICFEFLIKILLLKIAVAILLKIGQ